MHGRFEAAVQRMLDDALEWRETGAAAHQDHRPGRVLAQEKTALRSADAQQCLDLHLVEYMIGEFAAFDIAHVQFQKRAVVRRIGDGEAAGLAVLEQDVDILPGAERERLRLGQLQIQGHDIVRQPLHARDAAGQRDNRDVLQRADLARLDDQIAEGQGLTEQGQPLFLLRGAESFRQTAGVADLARHQPALAGAAIAIAATERQCDALPLGGAEQGFALGDSELLATGKDLDGMRHGYAGNCRGHGARYAPYIKGGHCP